MYVVYTHYNREHELIKEIFLFATSKFDFFSFSKKKPMPEGGGGDVPPPERERERRGGSSVPLLSI